MNHSIKQPHGDKYYVHPNNKGWTVGCENSPHASYAFSKKDKAIHTAKLLAQENRADVIVKNADGSVERHLSYS